MQGSRSGLEEQTRPSSGRSGMRSERIGETLFEQRLRIELQQLVRPRHARWDAFGLLELAKRWSASPPERPVWLVAFDKEEWGMIGSRALAQELRQQEQPLRLMVSLEMLGYTSLQQRYPQEEIREGFGDCGDFIALVANNDAAHLLPVLGRDMGTHVCTKVLPVPLRGEQMPEVRLSDHSPFWDAGYNAVMVTETSFMRNPHYHQPTDTIEALDLPFLMAVINGLEFAIGKLT